MTRAAIVKDVPMWQYLLAFENVGAQLQVAVERGDISPRHYENAIGGVMTLGRELDQLIADAIAAHPYGYRTPDLTPAEAEASAHFFDQED